jgi:hypothetical protein
MGIKIVTVYYPDGMHLGNMTIRPMTDIKSTEMGEEFIDYRCSVVFMCINERPLTVSGFEIFDTEGKKVGEFSVQPFELKAKVIKRFVVVIPASSLEDPHRVIIR